MKHTPVLLERCVTLLAPAISKPDAVVVDATLGLGGHSEAMLQQFPHLTLVGIDRDPHALAQSRARLAEFATRTHLVHAVYDEIPEVLADLGIPGVDGILFDLGVSSMQLDERDRGFAYSQDAPLDMRMNPEAGQPASEWLNEVGELELRKVLACSFGVHNAGHSLHSRQFSLDLLELLLELGPGVSSELVDSFLPFGQVLLARVLGVL